MENLELVFRALWTLSRTEKLELRALTNDPALGRSLFRQWLDHPGPGIYAVTAMIRGRTFGWSAVALGTGWNMGTVGAFVYPDFRGAGMARKAVTVLLDNLAALRPEWSEFLCYKEGLEHLFRPAIERHGFKDFWRNQEEYRQRSDQVTECGRT